MINEPLTATQGIIQTAIGNLSKQPSNNRLVYNSGQAFNPVTVMLWTIPIISFYEGIFYYITFTTVSYPWSVLGLEGMMIMMILLGGLFTCFFFIGRRWGYNSLARCRAFLATDLVLSHGRQRRVFWHIFRGMEMVGSPRETWETRYICL